MFGIENCETAVQTINSCFEKWLFQNIKKTVNFKKWLFQNKKKTGNFAVLAVLEGGGGW